MPFYFFMCTYKLLIYMIHLLQNLSTYSVQFHKLYYNCIEFRILIHKFKLKYILIIVIYKIMYEVICMEEKYRYLSEMERYEIININDGDKYGTLGNNDIVINENGELELLLLGDGKSSKMFFRNNDMLEVSWDYVKKIGSKTIIIDVDGDTLRKSHI
jgi:YlmC/YmxH family sporulation protein